MQDQEIIQLSDREHILLRPSMYIGSVDPITKEEYVLENDKFVKKELTYVPGLIKIINEVIDNSVDEAIKTKYQFGNKIKIDINSSTVKVEDNGRGIPVKKSSDGHYMPVLAYCNARAGSNFTNDNRVSVGMNGIGTKATNIFSKRFEAITSDGEHKLHLICNDNMSTDDFSIRKNSSRGTTVEFDPDLEKFSLTEIDNAHISIIEQRINFLSMSHPEIKFIFNGKRIQSNTEKSFMSKFSDSFEILSNDDWFVGVFPNEQDDFSFFTYVNGLYIKNGGNHINIISYEIVNRIREKLVKKYKTLKPGDVRNKLSLVVFFKNFPNMKFDSQTKETLTNSTSEIRSYMNISSDDWEAFGKKVLRNSELIDPIIEIFKIKEELQKRKELKNLSATPKKRIVNDKYLAPVGNKKYLLLAEGDSAVAGISPVIGRKDTAYFALRGKPLNAYDAKILKITANKEIQSIVDILELDMTNKDTEASFEKIIFSSDQDSDGIHIRSLLLAFFERFAPKLIDQERICFLQTPLIVGKKNGKIKNWFFSLQDYQNHIQSNTEKVDYHYYKGLGSWTKSDLQEIVEKVGGLEGLLVSFKRIRNSEKEIENWLSSSTADERKNKLRGKSFNISIA